MKISKLFLFAILLFAAANLLAQEGPSSELAKSDTPTPDLRLNSDAVATASFMDVYDLRNMQEKKGKVISNTMMWPTPDEKSNNNNVTIPSGTIVSIYKYFPDEASWAIKYRNTWGFISASDVMPVKDATQSSKYTPYDDAPRLLSQIKLEYPAQAKRNGIEGKVLLYILIDESGKVVNSEIIDGIPELNQAAIDAVTRLKFKPAKLEGEKVKVWVKIPLQFDIRY